MRNSMIIILAVSVVAACSDGEGTALVEERLNPAVFGDLSTKRTDILSRWVSLTAIR